MNLLVKVSLGKHLTSGLKGPNIFWVQLSNITDFFLLIVSEENAAF